MQPSMRYILASSQSHPQPGKTIVYLSKSQYLRGLQCHRALWLYRHRRELMAAVDSNREALFATGHEVGELAKSRFPGGVEIEFDGRDFDGMCARTAALIEQGVEVIYEATFRSDGLLAMADILQRNGDRWDFYEVKSSTRVKPYHLDDAAIQWHILSTQLTPGRAHIVHINNRYRRGDELDLEQLFQIEDVTAKVLQKQARLQTSVRAMRTMLDDAEPDIAIGMHCNNPFECDFKAHCWKAVPAQSVFNLYQLSAERKFELFHQGLVRYQDLREIELSPTQALQLSTATSGHIHIERERIANFIDAAVFPIHFLDFETLQHAVPRFAGQRPYQQIPFQYSLHILQSDGRLEHHEYLADENCDPRPSLGAQLARDLEPGGSIVAYSKSTEIAALNMLASHCPGQAPALRACIDRFIDLLTPFRGLMYYHPDFNGDFSIKSILPAMFPNAENLDYTRLEIQDGRAAMTRYAGLAQIADPGQRQRSRDALLAYCRLDTFAMVKIWQALADAANLKENES
jgi:hypothetical protein